MSCPTEVRISENPSTTVTSVHRLLLLPLAIFAANSTIGSESIFPLLLDFGTFPRPAQATPAIGQLEQPGALQTARMAYASEAGKRTFSFGRPHSTTPKGKDHSDNAEAPRWLHGVCFQIENEPLGRTLTPH